MLKMWVLFRGYCTLELMKACTVSSTVVFCSTSLRYVMMSESLIPAKEPGKSSTAAWSQSILLNTALTPTLHTHTKTNFTAQILCLLVFIVFITAC